MQANANIDLKWTLRSQPPELAFRGWKEMSAPFTSTVVPAN